MDNSTSSNQQIGSSQVRQDLHEHHNCRRCWPAVGHETWLRRRGFKLDIASVMAAAKPLACLDKGPACNREGASAGRAGADMSIDGRTDSSSTQYGTACEAIDTEIGEQTRHCSAKDRILGCHDSPVWVALDWEWQGTRSLQWVIIGSVGPVGKSCLNYVVRRNAPEPCPA